MASYNIKFSNYFFNIFDVFSGFFLLLLNFDNCINRIFDLILDKVYQIKAYDLPLPLTTLTYFLFQYFWEISFSSTASTQLTQQRKVLNMHDACTMCIAHTRYI